METIKTLKSTVLAQHRSLLARTQEKQSQTTFTLYGYQSSMISISSTPLLAVQFRSLLRESHRLSLLHPTHPNPLALHPIPVLI